MYIYTYIYIQREKYRKTADITTGVDPINRNIHNVTNQQG